MIRLPPVLIVMRTYRPSWGIERSQNTFDSAVITLSIYDNFDISQLGAMVFGGFEHQSFAND